MATLIYHSGALGDFITALPAMSVWRRCHAGERAILLGRPAFAGLADPSFDIVIDAGSPAVSGLFGGIHSALLFASPASQLPKSLASAGVTEIVRQDPFPSERVPIVDYHLSLFPESVLTAEDRLPRVRVLPEAGFVAAPCIALHPGSGSTRKNWPRERFVELARCSMESGAHVAWISGPVEGEEKTPLSGMETWASLPLPELASRLSRCVVYVGNDSGVTHCAAASGCPTIVLFGATDPAVWMPRGRNVHLIASTSKEMEEISLKEVVRLCQLMWAR